MWENCGVEPSGGYNRIVRKTLHIMAGLPALLVPLTPYWMILALAISASIVAWFVKPNHTKWLAQIAKPSDQRNGRFLGFLGYAVAILVLVAGWPLLDSIGLSGARFLMLGWLSLALGDGLAGLVGPGPGVTPTVPWCDTKTYIGMAGGFVGMYAAFVISFGLDYGIPGVLPQSTLVLAALVCAIPSAFLESLELKLDDNYMVGLGAPAIALIMHLVAGW